MAEADKQIAEIRKLLKGKNIIIGTEKTIKSLKLGKTKEIYLSSNCPENIINTIEHYSKLTKVSVVRLKHPSNELGILCKKPFSISVLSVPR